MIYYYDKIQNLGKYKIDYLFKNEFKLNNKNKAINKK